MSWVVIVLAGAALAACISILDKTIVHKYARTPSTQPLAIGFTLPFVGTALLLVFGIPESATLENVLLALLSGAFYGLGTHILIHTLFTREVSRAIPVYQTYPIFTALIAFFFLGERLGAVEWLAVLAIVGGAVLISSGPGASRGFLPDRTFMLLMLGSLIEGSSFVLGKSAVNELPVLFVHALRMFALSSVLLVFNLRRAPLDDIVSFFRTRSPALGYMALNQFIVANTSLFLLLWALSLGPTTLVTALSSLRTFFLVIFTIGLSLIWRGALGEVTTRGTVTVKLVSTALIVGGAVVIALGSG
ncbi:MAG: EamA family transporter [Chloroflexota bacterium]|nr:EamA family transporter [Chloroflexota bacterium]MDE2885357.1 EamA family transporter [Chloroflexota bacterium]